MVRIKLRFCTWGTGMGMEWVMAQGGVRMKGVGLDILNCSRQWTIHMRCSVGIQSLEVGRGRAHIQNWDWSAQRQELNIWGQIPLQRVSPVAQMIICLQCRRPGFDPWVGNIPGGGNGNPLQYPCLENPMDRGAWWATVHGVAKTMAWLSTQTHTHTHTHTHTCTHAKVLKSYRVCSLFFFFFVCSLITVELC